MASFDKPARNSLVNSRSPYLLQHASNPVDWKEWGEDAFAEAKSRQVPIFLSVGYSTCHWCHVMARESFEDESIGGRMNELFVNIKVDREERPDVDRIYMSYVQSVSGSGGWPMSVWLTPELKPFYGGTYFPPEDRYGRVGFLTLIERIGQLWRDEPGSLLEYGEKSTRLLSENASRDLRQGVEEAAVAIDLCLEQLDGEFDEDWGGFGTAPKFPMPAYLQLLSEGVARRGNSRLEEMLSATLKKMSEGGMWDHVGGGFHRYSVDNYWHIPHYEKMLYDQGQLAAIYADAYRLTGNESFRGVARQIVDYVSRDLRGNGGQLFAAEDADSALPEDGTKHGEGAFYVWRKEELDTLLGADVELFCAAFDVQANGNARPESDPHGELAGTNTLMRVLSDSELAERFSVDESEVSESIGKSLGILFEVRSRRPRPHLDDKTLAAWSGLMISGACKVYQATGYKKALELAVDASNFLWLNLWNSDRRELRRTYRKGCGDAKGFAEDYAAVACAFIDLYESTFESCWVERARLVVEQLCNRFMDTERGGFFSTEEASHSLVRLRDDYDGAEPAASSLAAHALMRLAAILDDGDLRKLGRQTIEAFGSQWKQAPRAMAYMLVAASRFLESDQQIVIVGRRNDEKTEALLAASNRFRRPHSVLILADSGKEIPVVLSGNEKLVSMLKATPRGEVLVYVCENYACQEPVQTVAALESLLN